MKKYVLLAGVACLFAANAEARTYDMTPIIGLDYAYSDADLKGEAKPVNNDFSSGIFTAGVRFDEYASLEAFFQMAGEEKGRAADIPYKTEWNAYGLDAIGHMPIGCEQKFEALASLGIGLYDIDVKKDDVKNSFTKVGYRGAIGAQYNITEDLSARIMGRYVYIGSGSMHDIKEATIGMRYAF